MSLDDHLFPNWHVSIHYLHHRNSLIYHYFLLDYDGRLNKDLVSDNDLFCDDLGLWLNDYLDW